jgi:hypothetical protein
MFIVLGFANGRVLPKLVSASCLGDLQCPPVIVREDTPADPKRHSHKKSRVRSIKYIKRWRASDKNFIFRRLPEIPLRSRSLERPESSAFNASLLKQRSPTGCNCHHLLIAWIRSQGFDPRTLPRKSLWFLPNGRGAYAPSDPYHLGLYRQRGMTLKEPIIAAQDFKPRSIPVPSIAKQVMYLLGQVERWEGSATELAATIGNRTPTGLSRLLNTPKGTYGTLRTMDRTLFAHKRHVLPCDDRS